MQMDSDQFESMHLLSSKLTPMLHPGRMSLYRQTRNKTLDSLHQENRASAAAFTSGIRGHSIQELESQPATQNTGFCNLL